MSHPDAGRRIRAMDNLDDGKFAINLPQKEWPVSLLPAQRELIGRDFDGSALFTGSSGIGKTVVALHRAARLSKSSDTRVFLATLSTELAKRISENAQLIADPTVSRRMKLAALEEMIS